MDYNDINLRLKRIYSSIDSMSKYGAEALVGINTTKEEIDDGKFMLTISFGNEVDSLNKIHQIISNLANLKDVFINKILALGKSKSLVENAINDSSTLQLIMDLSNQEKHGYPLTKCRRSGKDPQIKNVRSGMGPSNKPDNIRHSLNDGSTLLNMMISIKADIVDKDGKHICTLDQLVKEALDEWEELIKKNQLGN